MSNWLVLAPCFYPTAQPVWRLVESAKRHGIGLHLYGLGEPFKGWLDSHIIRLKQELQASDKRYFLFTDAIDAFFLDSMPEIVTKYKLMDSPPLVAAWEPSGLNAGGFVGERLWMLDCLDYILNFKCDSGNPQVRWRSCNIRIDSGMIELDHESWIFQTTSDGQGESLSVQGTRLYNSRTGSWPCVLHVCGGYTSPTTFRDEQLKPWWEMTEGLCQTT